MTESTTRDKLLAWLPAGNHLRALLSQDPGFSESLAEILGAAWEEGYSEGRGEVPTDRPRHPNPWWPPPGCQWPPGCPAEAQRGHKLCTAHWRAVRSLLEPA